MKILIANSKEMRDVKCLEKEKLSKNTLEILEILSRKDVKELSNMYKIKEKDAIIEKNRFESILNETSNYHNALDLFYGLMYRNLDVDTLDESCKKYLKDNLYIITALYGILEIDTRICKHRLDFLNNLSLKKIWNKDFDEKLKNEKLIISLLSKEFEDIFSKEIRNKFIKIEFLENKNGKLFKHSTISKKARGKFVRYLAINKIKSLEEIKKINLDGYKYSEIESNENRYIFIK